MNHELFGVCGAPILHSRSPLLFRQWFGKTGISATYLKVHCQDAKMLLEMAQEIGFKGLNITSPLKEKVYELVQDRDASAVSVSGTNCLVLSYHDQLNENYCNHIKAFNTDAEGILGALSSYICRLPEEEKLCILILGAGGAARAAISALKPYSARIIVLNRTLAKAEKLGREYDLESGSLKDFARYISRADLIINTIPAALHGLDFSAVRPQAAILDAIYKNPPLRQLAQAKGIEYFSGEDWLYHQARASYRRWFDQEPPACSLLEPAAKEQA
ncbi:MAG: hypothetical protein U1C33_05475, partial [Candidatus Cloacimonadaceae bacterium]|nr:hypothetical protein [Candidatus Cloacimonadaceae bacterium]